MSQFYVPEGALTLCTEGKKPAKIKVQSQYSIKIDGGKLAATEADRFDGNFMCIKMLYAGALIGALVGVAVALTGGAALGGILAAIAGTEAGALPRNNGQRMELETGVSWFPNPAEGHMVHYLVEALKKEMDNQGKTTVVANDK